MQWYYGCWQLKQGSCPWNKVKVCFAAIVYFLQAGVDWNEASAVVGPGQEHAEPKEPESQECQSKPFPSCFVLGSGNRHKGGNFVLCSWAVNNGNNCYLSKLTRTCFQKYFLLIFMLFGELYKHSNAFLCLKFLEMPAVLRPVSCNAGGGKKVNRCNYWILM